MADDDLHSVQQARTELIAFAERFAAADGLHETALPMLQFIRAGAPGAPLPAVYEPGIVLVLQGRKQAVLGGDVLDYDALHCLVVSMTALPMGRIVEASRERPYLCVRLNVDLAELAALLLQAPAVEAPVAPARALRVARVTSPLLDAVLRLVRLLDAPQDAPVLAPLALREICWRVLTGELGPQLRALADADGHGRRIARAVALIRRRFDEPLRIGEVADAAHMSASTLHLHFKQATAMTPLQYQKRLRLHEARRLMLGEGLEAAAAAHRVGYESASQFSREYRRLFGAPPRAEVQTLRGAGAREAAAADAG